MGKSVNRSSVACGWSKKVHHQKTVSSKKAGPCLRRFAENFDSGRAVAFVNLHGPHRLTVRQVTLGKSAGTRGKGNACGLLGQRIAPGFPVIRPQTGDPDRRAAICDPWWSQADLTVGPALRQETPCRGLRWSATVCSGAAHQACCQPGLSGFPQIEENPVWAGATSRMQARLGESRRISCPFRLPGGPREKAWDPQGQAGSAPAGSAQVPGLQPELAAPLHAVLFQQPLVHVGQVTGAVKDSDVALSVGDFIAHHLECLAIAMMDDG